MKNMWLSLPKAQRLAIIGFVTGVIAVIAAVLITRSGGQAGGISIAELLIVSVIFGAVVLFLAVMLRAAMAVLRRQP